MIKSKSKFTQQLEISIGFSFSYPQINMFHNLDTLMVYSGTHLPKKQCRNLIILYLL